MALPSPGIETQKAVASHIFVTCSGIMVWDILDNVKDDYAMLRHYRIKAPTAVYFLSRAFSLGFLILVTVFQTAQISDCMRLGEWIAWIYTAAISLTSLLFTLRVRAIYEGNKYITAFFGLLWLVVVGTAFLTTKGDKVGQLGSTKKCVNEHYAGYLTGSAIAPFINDTLVFLAISWRLIMMHNTRAGEDHKLRLRAMILGRRMPSFSRTLLKDGQLYYLTTVSTNILAVILILVHPATGAYATMLSGPNIMLMNIMACRVFRNTKLGLFANTMTENTIPTFHIENTITLSPNQRPHALSPITFQKFSSRGDPLDGAHSVPIDPGTKELGIEHAVTTGDIRLPSNPSEHGMGEDSYERGNTKPSQ